MYASLKYLKGFWLSYNSLFANRMEPQSSDMNTSATHSFAFQSTGVRGGGGGKKSDVFMKHRLMIYYHVNQLYSTALLQKNRWHLSQSISLILIPASVQWHPDDYKRCISTGLHMHRHINSHAEQDTGVAGKLISGLVSHGKELPLYTQPSIKHTSASQRKPLHCKNPDRKGIFLSTFLSSSPCFFFNKKITYFKLPFYKEKEYYSQLSI